MNFFCNLTIVIPPLCCLFNMANAVSSMVVLVNSDTSDSVSLFHFEMGAFASKCVPMELVPCSDGWRRTWWQMIHIMPGLPVSSIPQCKYNHHDGACQEFFQPIGSFKPTCIAAHQLSNMICKVRSVKSWIKTYSFLQDILTSSNMKFIDWESHIAVWCWRPCYSAWETVKGDIIIE